jgi:alcohol dehydrogenase class IV
MPKVAICDPLLTIGLPPQLTAATGMDAIAHCMETFMAAPFNPPADGIALDGLRRAWAHIEKATNQGQDRNARLQMMSASMQGAMAFQKGLGCVHSLSHSLGGVNPKLHHGTLNAIFLPSVIRFNQDAQSVIDESRILRMAQAMGLTSAQDVIPAIVDLNQRLGLPKGLKDLGVHQKLFPNIIQGAIKDHCHLMNPKIATPEDYEMMLQESM